ncbi:MAG: MFS transporter [Pseudomonadales bacterium]|nr:MFS transporter [Pseudomonadales bacterium]
MPLSRPERDRALEFRKIIAALPGIALGNFAIFTAPIYIGSLVDGLGYDERQAGLISTLEIGAVALTCLMLSNILNRLPLRRVSGVGIIIVVASNVLTYWADQIIQVATLRILAGLGAGLCLAIAGSLISRTTDADRTVGTLLAVNTLLMVVILMLLGWAKSIWMFNGYLAVYALLAGLLVPLLIFIPQRSGDAPHSASIPPSEARIGLGLLGLATFTLFCVLEGGVWSFSERSGTQLGFTDPEIGMFLGLAQVAGLIAALIAAIFGARIPRIYPIITGIPLMGIAGFTIYQTASQAVYAISLALFLFGFFFAFPYLLGAFARLDIHGRWLARANGANLLGGAIAPAIAGSVVSTTDFQTLGIFLTGVATITAILAVSFSANLTRDTLTRDYSESASG